MNENLLPLIEKFSGLRVLVIGDLMLDVLVNGATERLCREAPVPIVHVSRAVDAPGGAGNTAANLAALGAQARVVGVVGEDEAGERLLRELRRDGVDTSFVVRSEAYTTLKKSRVMAASQVLLRIDEGSPRDELASEQVAEQLESTLDWADVVVISDYEYGVLSAPVVHLLESKNVSEHAPLIVDAKNPAKYAALHPTAIKPNFEEVSRLLGPDAAMLRVDSTMMYSLGEKLLDITKAHIAAVTLDSEGALIFESGQAPYRTYAKASPDSRATGAGDSFISGLSLALGAGASTPAAAEIASAAARVVVEKEGTCTCSVGELIEAVSGEEKVIGSLGHLNELVQEKRKHGKRIVFTNGCFDIIHRGHVSYLSAAKAQGDILVVGLNSDESVSRIKGPERPINCLEDRLQILSALSCIDFLVSFDEDTPSRLIEAIKPDVFVKGGDYTRETLPEGDLVEACGGRIEFIPYVPDHSTTGIIGRIRAAMAS